MKIYIKLISCYGFQIRICETAKILPMATCILITLLLRFSALVWGSSVKHNPQNVGKDHTLFDEDVVQIVKRK